MAIIALDEDDLYVYANGSGFTPSREVHLEVRSSAVPPNESTEGITAGMHKTARQDGTVQFKVPKAYLLQDLPRKVEARASIGDVAEAEQVFK